MGLFAIGLTLGLVIAAGLDVVLAKTHHREDELERALIAILQEAERPDTGTCLRVSRLAREALR